MSTESVDVAVIGAGAGGGVVANELAQSGQRVALFDRGRHFSAVDFGHDELADSQAPWNRYGRRFGPDFIEHQTYRPDPGVPARQVSLRDRYSRSWGGAWVEERLVTRACRGGFTQKLFG